MSLLKKLSGLYHMLYFAVLCLCAIIWPVSRLLTPYWKWKCELVAQLCPTVCDLMDCGLPGSSIHGISQARILEWVAIPFSRGSSWPRDRTQVSCIAGRFFTSWATREAILPVHHWLHLGTLSDQGLFSFVFLSIISLCMEMNKLVLLLFCLCFWILFPLLRCYFHEVKFQAYHNWCCIPETNAEPGAELVLNNYFIKSKLVFAVLVWWEILSAQGFELVHLCIHTV